MNINYILFLTARFLSLFALRVVDFAFPLAIYKITGSLSMSGAAIACDWLPRLIALPIFGALADKYQGKNLIILADLGRAFLVVIPFFFMNKMVILICLSVLGLFSTLSQITLESSVARFISLKKVATAQIGLELVQNLSMILGSLFAGILITYLSLESVFIVNSALFLIPIFFMLPIRMKYNFSSDSSVGPNKMGPIQAFETIFHIPELKKVTLVGIIISIMYGIMLATAPAMVKTVYLRSDSDFAALQLLTAFVSIAVLILAGKLRHQFSEGILLSCGLFLTMFGMTITAFSPTFMIYINGYAAFFAGILLFSIYLRFERVRLIPKEHYGKIIGFAMIATVTGLPFGGGLVWMIGDRLNPQTIMLLMLAILPFLAFYINNRKVISDQSLNMANTHL